MVAGAAGGDWKPREAARCISAIEVDASNNQIRIIVLPFSDSFSIVQAIACAKTMICPFAR